MAGGTIYPDYPRTLIYDFERRRWRVEFETTNAASNILFIGGSRRGWQKVSGTNIIDCGENPAPLHLVFNVDRLPVPELLRKLKPVTRSYPVK